MWEEDKGWTNSKNNIKSKSGQGRCIKPIYLKGGFVLENVVI